MAERVFIGIGSNLGSKEENITQALELLKADGRSLVAAVASLYRTDPVGYTDQDWFLNTVAVLETDLSPGDLLGFLLETENKIGRERTIHWGPRVIDLDILLYGNLTITSTDLQIPHPRLEERAFVVVPLAELFPDLTLPGGSAASNLAAQLSKNQRVEKYK